MTSFIRNSFYGLSVDKTSENDLEKYIEKTIALNETRVLYGHSIWTIPMMTIYPEIFHYGEQADVLTTDGRIFYILCKLSGIKLISDISIPQMVMLVLRLANENNYSVYLLGATQQINSEAREKISEKYHGIEKISGHHGYFDDSQHENISSEIARFQPNILLIGISSPIKEILSIKWKSKTNANITIPCGGMIDVLAEKTKLTPRIIKKLGLASLFRLLQEPKRLLKRNAFVYRFAFLNFFPLLFWETIIRRNKNFSIPKYYKVIS